MVKKKEILGFKIQKFKQDDIIPVDAVFLEKEKTQRVACGIVFTWECYIFKVPIYK